MISELESGDFWTNWKLGRYENIGNLAVWGGGGVICMNTEELNNLSQMRQKLECEMSVIRWNFGSFGTFHVGEGEGAAP